MPGAVLDLDPRDFLTASSHADSAASTMASARDELLAALAGSARMAGSDPAGRRWSTEYDKAVAAMVSGTDSLESAFGRIAAGLSVSGLNYATAEWLSAGRAGIPPGYIVPTMPREVCSPMLPSVSGGTGTCGIPAWHYVADGIGDLWPDGDIDKLRAAQAAWVAFADALDDVHGADVPRILSALDAVHTPEQSTIRAKVTTVSAGVTHVAQEARNLAAGAGQFADQIDGVHRQTEMALQELLEQVAATAVIGVGLTIATAGLSDAAAGLAAGGEVAATVARILAFIAELGSNVARVVDTVAESAGSIARVARISEQVTIRIVTIAGNSVVTGVGGAALNVGASVITDPGGDLESAAVEGFVGGAAFGAVADGAGMAVKAVAARRALTEALGEYSAASLRHLEILDEPVPLFDGAGQPIATRDLVHPRADLLDGQFTPQARQPGLSGDSEAVQELLPRGYSRWNGGSEDEYAAEFTTGDLYPDGAPVIRSEAWPDETAHPDGFESADKRTPVILKPGFRMDRFGNVQGRFASPQGTPFPPRALSDYSLNAGYHQYEVLHSVPAWAGPTADAFDKVGGTPQIHMGIATIEQLLRDGLIKEVTT